MAAFICHLLYFACRVSMTALTVCSVVEVWQCRTFNIPRNHILKPVERHDYGIPQKGTLKTRNPMRYKINKTIVCSFEFLKPMNFYEPISRHFPTNFAKPRPDNSYIVTIIFIIISRKPLNEVCTMNNHFTLCLKCYDITCHSVCHLKLSTKR